MRLPVVEVPGQIEWNGDEVVLMSVKSQDTEEILRCLAASAPSSIRVVCLQRLANRVARDRARPGSMRAADVLALLDPA
jgi:hypothetical protein